MKPVVIAVAITGSVPRKKDNPARARPRPPSRWRARTRRSRPGRRLVHIHVRNPDESPSSDPALFAQVQEGVRRHCPGMIIQFSTGGRGRDPAARGNALDLRPDMASLSHRLGQLPDHRLRELGRAGDRPRHQDAGASACGRRSSCST